MSDALDLLANDEVCRAVLITGAGEAFSAGFDLDEFKRPELAGGAVAGDLALTGRRIDATEAQMLGLVTRVVSKERVVDEARQVAVEIASAPRGILLAMKAKIMRRACVELGTTLDL